MSATERIHSILVATDLTSESLEAVRGAADLALAAGAKLHVVHAHEESGFAAESRDVLSAQRKVHEKRRTLLETVRDLVPEAVDLGSARVELGSAADVILSDAKSVAADVIVLGAHHNRGFADRFLGSTAEQVLRYASVPCLIMNGSLSLPVERVLIPTDLSETSGLATNVGIGWASRFARQSIASVTLAHVMNPFAQFEQVPWTEQEREADLRSAAREALRNKEARVRLDVEVLQGEHPAERLIDYATETNTGLIVMGTHGDGILLRAILGSVSSKMVRQSPIPVLLVPRAGAEYHSPGEGQGQRVSTVPEPVPF